MSPPLDPRDFTDPYIRSFARVPPPGDGVCRVCHGGPGAGFTICSSCYKTTGQVTHPADLVVPITLYEVQGQMWHTLRNYKDGPSETVRAPLGDRVAAMMARFLGQHRECIEAALGSRLTAVSIVPSSGSRPGVHPLELAVRRVSSIRDLEPLELRQGSTPITHNSASDTGFEVVGEAAGHAVLLIDDTFTSGARCQSAASALHLSGASCVAVLALGRVIYPTWNDACAAIWSERHLFDFDVCCLE